jgi:glutaconate CoA-transferase subunit A
VAACNTLLQQEDAMTAGPKHNKVTSLQQAVASFVKDGAVVGIGGQNISRCAIAIAHEIIRQHRRDLTLVGCNLSMHADLLVGAGTVRRIECGTANLERFGPAHQCRRAIEEQRIEVEDFDHLSMLSRFLAAEMGVPFMPVNTPLGTDLIHSSAQSTMQKFCEMQNPWDAGERVLLAPALHPDVSILHVQFADELGNVVIHGVLHHEPEMVRASRATIVTCEQLIPSEEIRRGRYLTTFPFHFVDAVVPQHFGAYPTGTYGFYSHHEEEIGRYQHCAREGGVTYDRYLDEHVYGCPSFDLYLSQAAEDNVLTVLERTMHGAHALSNGINSNRPQ